jgi:cyanophycinase
MVQPPGTVALVGSGEFLPPMASIDRALLAHLRATPRVAIVPTAAAPDGAAVFDRWLRQGVDYFTGLGAEAVPIALRTRADADDPELATQLATCDFVYLSGGKPGYLRDTLRDSACWQTIVGVSDRGGVIAGCSAGAMVLGERMIDFPQVWRLGPALSLVRGLAIVPHFDEFGMKFLGGLESLVAGDVTLVGVDGTTALVGTGGRWTVVGRGGVTIIDGPEPRRYVGGTDVPLREPEPA